MCPYMKSINGSLYDSIESNITFCLILRKHVDIMFFHDEIYLCDARDVPSLR